MFTRCNAEPHHFSAESSTSKRVFSPERHSHARHRVNRAAHAAFEPLESRLLLSAGTPAKAVAPNLDLFPIFLNFHTLSSLTNLSGSTATTAGLVIDGSGNLFGVTTSGGSNSDGSVFEIPSGSATPQTLGSFNGSNGSVPNSQLLIDKNGNLYGTTASGGADNFGAVFELANNGSGRYTLSVLASFSGYAGNGAVPQGPLVMDKSGDLFGVTSSQSSDDTNPSGSASNGTIFEIASGSTTATTVADFNSGGFPTGGLVIDANNNLYGVTSSGGANGLGEVFEVLAGSTTIQSMVDFNGTNGNFPQGLTIDSAGNLFGTTYRGGANDFGTVFEIPLGGSLTTLASFDGNSAAYPVGGIFVDGSGNLYGSAAGAGNSNDGAVYEVASGSGQANALASFNTNIGFQPNPGIVEDANGNFFGTTDYGGAAGRGSVFELSPENFTGPAATVSAKNITTPNSNPEQVTVTYSDPAGIVIGLNSINSGNLTVTDAKQNSLTVESSVSISQNGNSSSGTPTTVIATYNVDAPSGGWTMSDNANSPYSITVQGVTDSNGNSVQSTTGSFNVSIGTGPTVSISAPTVTSPGAHDSQIAVTFKDPSGVVLNSVTQLDTRLVVRVISAANQSIVGNVLAPDNFSVNPRLGGSYPTVTAYYSIAAPYVANGAPKGDWFAGDNGTYNVSLATGIVADTNGQTNAAASQDFSVNIPPTPPSGTITPPAPITTAGSAPESVVVTYTGAESVLPSSITAGNISVTGPFGNNLVVEPMVTTDDTANTASPKIVATYTVDAPAGGWVNGGYSVTLNAGQVKDTFNQTNAQATSSFVANVPPPVFPNTSSPSFNLGFKATASAITADGTTLVVGNQENTAGTGLDGVLERLTPGGPDSTFGSGGQIVFPGVQLYSVAVIPSGSSYNILFGGTSGGKLLAGEYTATGLPASFGSNGLQAIAVSGATDAIAYSVTVNTVNNDIVAGGAANGEFVVDQLLATGTQDPGFNGGAPLEFSDGHPDVLGTVRVDSNGRIVGAGAGGQSGASVLVARISATGALDPTFGVNGLVDASNLFAASQPELTTDSQAGGQLDHTEGLAIDSNGRIIVANGTALGYFGVVRLNSNGSDDASWGAGGLATANFNNTAADADAVLINGSQILAIGTTADRNGFVQTAVAAFTDTGALDTTFGTNNSGEETFDPSPQSANPSSVTSLRVIHPDAYGLGGLYFGYASLTNGHLVAGSDVPGRSTVRTLIVATPLISGTLNVSVSTTLPASVIEGARANQKIRVTVSNPSSSVVSLESLQFYVNTFASVTGATPLGIQFAKPISLKPGAHKTITLKLPSYPNVPAAGNYLVIASATASDNTVTQVRSSLTTNIAPPTFAGTISGVQPLVGSVAPGKSATIGLTLVNSGNEPLSGTATVTITGKLGTQIVPISTVALRGVKLKSGSKAYRVKVRIPASLTAGSYTLSVSLSGLGLPSAITATANAPLTVT